MKLKFCALLLVVLVTATAQAAEKQKTFGAGVILGEPTGITAKYWLDNRLAIDGGIGWKTSGDREFHLYADVLYHLHDLIVIKRGKLPVYLGCGARYVNQDQKDDKIGIRIPVGIEYHFDTLPLGAFAELAPVLNLTPDTDADLGGGIGLRFYF